MRFAHACATLAPRTHEQTVLVQHLPPTGSSRAHAGTCCKVAPPRLVLEVAVAAVATLHGPLVPRAGVAGLASLVCLLGAVAGHRAAAWSDGRRAGRTLADGACEARQSV